MKSILLFMLLICFLSGSSMDQNTSRMCSEIINEINFLKNEKLKNTSSKIVTIIFTGGYGYGLSNDEIDMKIRVLQLKLLNCQ